MEIKKGKIGCKKGDFLDNQYIVEIDVFNKAVKRAVLNVDKNHNSKFPNSKLVTVSILN